MPNFEYIFRLRGRDSIVTEKFFFDFSPSFRLYYGCYRENHIKADLYVSFQFSNFIYIYFLESAHIYKFT